MKVVEQTKTRLTLKHHPIMQWLYGCGLTGAGCFLVANTLLSVPASAVLKCDRLTSTHLSCELKRYTLVGVQETLKIDDLQDAEVVTHRGSRGSTSYQISILTASGSIPLLEESNTSYQNQDIANQIHTFVTSAQPSLRVRQNAQGAQFLIIMALFFVAIGLFMVGTPLTICTFYKRLNKVVLEQKGLWRREVIECAFSQILYVDIESKRTRYSYVYRAVLVLKSGTLPINPGYTSEGSVRRAVASMRDFLERHH